MSDSRIKKDIVDVSDDQALIKLRQLQPKKYKYKDGRFGDKEVYGFIAQEVESIIPNSCNILEDYVPNIQLSANITSIEETSCILTTGIDNNLEINDIIRCRDSKYKEIDDIKVLEVIDSKTFKINKIFTADQSTFEDENGFQEQNIIFIYGKKVNDFHNLNKSAIWTIATAALQEVDRQLQAEKAKVATLENDSSHTNNINNFTGQHRCISVNNLDATDMCGLIAYSTGKYMNIDNSTSPTIVESLPICDICTTDNDTRVFGVISDQKDDNEDVYYGYGAFKTLQKKTNKNEIRLYMNSVGEGAVQICNKNGNILNGDYITSCTIPGYGAKQADDLLHNYSVAKITCSCDFNLTKIVKQKIKVSTIITTLKIEDFEQKTKEVRRIEVEYDENLQKYIEKEIIKIKHYKELVSNTFPLYDSDGNVKLDEEGEPRTHKVPIMKEIQETKTELLYDSNGNVQYEDDLDENGNQQMVYKYDTRFLNADGSLIVTETEYLTKKNAGENVYIACFVGCTYHCG